MQENATQEARPQNAGSMVCQCGMPQFAYEESEEDTSSKAQIRTELERSETEHLSTKKATSVQLSPLRRKMDVQNTMKLAFEQSEIH